MSLSSVSWKQKVRRLFKYLMVLVLLTARSSEGTTSQLPISPTSTSSSVSTTATHSSSQVTLQPMTTVLPVTTTDVSFSTHTSYLLSTTTTNSPLLPPTTDPDKYRLTIRDPPSCELSDCDVFVGINNHADNDSFLDIYLVGEAGGWVAVGFSKTHDMFAADVVACNRNPNTDEVEPLDAWNSAIKRRTTVDPNNDVIKFSTSYTDGRISCSVAKRIAATDPDHDLNLDSLLYILYGRRKADSGVNELYHHELGPGEVPKITDEQLNPFYLSASIDESFPRSILLRAHGIIMIVTWFVLASTGIFFASWMRQALPKERWLQVHRAFLLASLFLGAAGFMLAFVANYDRIPHGLVELGQGNPIGSAHFAVGVTVMLLHIINPVIAAFRCKQTSKRAHWIFKICHGIFIGRTLNLLAYVNMCLGTFLIFQTVTQVLWLAISLSVFLLLVNYVLLMFSKCSYKKTGQRKEMVSHFALDKHQLLSFADDEDDNIDEDEEEELTAFDGSLPEEMAKPKVSIPPKPQKRCSSKICLRWILLGTYLLISLSLTVAMVVLIAV